MHLNQFLNLVLSVETRHIGGAIILWVGTKIPLCQLLPK